MDWSVLVYAHIVYVYFTAYTREANEAEGFSGQPSHDL